MKTCNLFTTIHEESVHVFGGNRSFFSKLLHAHPETQITLILKGTGKVAVNQYVQRFKPGDIYLIRAGEPHLFGPDIREAAGSFATGEAQAIHILFNYEDYFERQLAFCEFDHVKTFFESRENWQFSSNQPKEQAIPEKIREISVAFGLKRLLLLIDLLSLLAQTSFSRKSLSSGLSLRLLEECDSRIQRVYSYAKENYAQKIMLDDIAAVAHLSPESFCKFFKKNALVTWGHFLDQIRIHEACKRMIQQKESATEAAYSCGFNSLTTFYRTFRRITGTSPKEWVESFTNKEVVRQTECA